MIRAVSKSRSKQLAVYRKLRDVFLAEHPTCCVQGCGRRATDCHHRVGRIGSLLVNAFHFRAVCRACHDRVKTNPDWAREHDLLPPVGQYNSTPRNSRKIIC